MTDGIDRIASLHAQLVDASKGYQEAHELAEKPEMVSLFAGLRGLHDKHATALAGALDRRGVEPDSDGTFFQYVHKAVLNIRSALTGLGENVLPAIADGEQRILESYDEALTANTDPELRNLLEQQRGEVASHLRELELRERHAEV